MNKMGPGGKSALAEASSRGNLRMMQILLNEKADVEQACPGYKNATPITVAATMQQHRAVDMLVKVRGQCSFLAILTQLKAFVLIEVHNYLNNIILKLKNETSVHGLVIQIIYDFREAPRLIRNKRMAAHLWSKPWRRGTNT